MITTVKDFVMDWNKTHGEAKFSAYKATGSERPVSVEVRYPELSKSELQSKDWNRLNVLVEEESEGTMIVTTNEKSFEKGIIQILISSRHSNFDERRVVFTLEKLGYYLEEK